MLNHSRIYEDVPFNSTIMLDLPNRDVSFMEAKVKFTNDDVGIYHGLYDGNQQTDTSFIFTGSCSISSPLIKYIDPFTTSATAAALGDGRYFTPFVCLRIIDYYLVSGCLTFKESSNHIDFSIINHRRSMI